MWVGQACDCVGQAHPGPPEEPGPLHSKYIQQYNMDAVVDLYIIEELSIALGGRLRSPSALLVIIAVSFEASKTEVFKLANRLLWWLNRYVLYPCNYEQK